MAFKLLSHTNGIEKKGNNSHPEKPITEIITNGFFTVDRNWTVTYWNKAAEKLLGVQSKDIVGKNLWEKFAATIPLDFYTSYHKAFLTDIPIHFHEYWGEMEAWYDVITYNCNNTLSVSFKNTTLQAQQGQYAQQQLKLLNELYRFVTELTNDCLWEWELNCKEIFWIDGGHQRVFGYQIVNAIIPQSFWESRLHPDDKTRILEKLKKVISDGSDSLWEDEYRFQKADGSYAYVHDRGYIIYDKNNRAVRMIGATQDISEKVLLQKKLVEERLNRQRELTAAIFKAQENEREIIGKELHDNLGQTLAVARMYLQMSKKNEKNKDLYIEKSSDFIINVMKEIRRISKNLVIPGTHIIGLFDNIKNLLADLKEITPVKIEFHKTGITEKDLDEQMQLTIFRIVQEQVNNILKHADASEAVIHLSRQDNEMTLLISDNGKGCDMTNEKNGVGIINIKSRAELYHGRVAIVTEPGHGFELKVIFLLNCQA